MDAQKFGAFLQTQRKQLGLTQTQLAEKIHVTDKAVSRWERGVGLPDIQLLEPIAEALELSLTELIRSETIEADTLPKAAADAAVAETLALAEKRRRRGSWWLSYALVCGVMAFFIAVVTRFVDIPWIRMVGIFLIIRCGTVFMRLVEKLLYPEKAQYQNWKWHLKELILSAAVLAFLLIFLLQPYIGLQNCGRLALLLVTALGIWGIWELRHYIRAMPQEPQQK